MQDAVIRNSEAGEMDVEQLINRMAVNKASIDEMLPMLPKELHDMVVNDHFLEDCQVQFDELDQNSDGVLSPDELYPVIKVKFKL